LAAPCPGNCLNANSPTAWFSFVVSKQTWPLRTPTRVWLMCRVPNFSSSQVKGKPRELVLCTAGPGVRAGGHLPAERAQPGAGGGQDRRPTQRVGPAPCHHHGHRHRQGPAREGSHLASSVGLNDAAACAAEGSFAVIKSITGGLQRRPVASTARVSFLVERRKLPCALEHLLINQIYTEFFLRGTR